MTWTSADIWGLLISYFSTTALALYLQYRSHAAALAKLTAAHEQNSADLRQHNEVLMTMITVLRHPEGSRQDGA